MGRRLRTDEDRVVVEDPPVELPQLVARFDPELLHERSPRLTVRRKRVRLPAGAVEGEHELAAEVLPIWMLRDQRLQFGDQFAV